MLGKNVSMFARASREVPVGDLPSVPDRRSKPRPLAGTAGVKAKGRRVKLPDEEAPAEGERSRPDGRPDNSEPVVVEASPGRSESGPERPEQASQLAQLGLAERLAAAGDIHLFSSEREPVEYGIQLATLQRMVLGQLRSELAEVVHDIYTGRSAKKYLMDDAKELITDYCNAVRDYDFMAERLQQSRDDEEDDPFEISTHRLLDLCLMRDAGLVPEKDWEKLLARVKGEKKLYKKRYNILPSVSRNDRGDVMTRNLSLERLGMGLAGGAALIVPMLIMVLHKDLVTTLVTTSVATMLFAGGLALLGTKLRGETVLASVAAYAAVLVVFVGTSDQAT
ncbi:hypothetical protein B0H67DRAFT_327235 [Lasiosphaeris hirsuta]|uniref:DUF6594 domain-containing protein n=1 Tax=Lasiosphaeris hirsuta TaxID=260670 RepID=A0AA40A2G9_9PEZI|nr:hypothetical protein B0H67DRAFT_327235 [Lasiosphaeris hirsuta]